MRIHSTVAAIALACCWILAAAAQRPDVLPPAGANFDNAAREAD